jgi:hypothetical protein
LFLLQRQREILGLLEQPLEDAERQSLLRELSSIETIFAAVNLKSEPPVKSTDQEPDRETTALPPESFPTVRDFVASHKRSGADDPNRSAFLRRRRPHRSSDPKSSNVRERPKNG